MDASNPLPPKNWTSFMIDPYVSHLIVAAVMCLYLKVLHIFYKLFLNFFKVNPN